MLGDGVCYNVVLTKLCLTNMENILSDPAEFFFFFFFFPNNWELMARLKLFAPKTLSNMCSFG